MIELEHERSGVKLVKDERARFTFRMPKQLIELIKEKAHQQGVSLNALILQILWDWAKKQVY